MRSGRYIVKHLTGTFFYFLVLFLSAGRIDYWQGWIYVMIGLIMFTLQYTVLRPGGDLMAERSKPGEGAKKWDKWLLGLSFITAMLMFIAAGLDSGRYHWSSDLPWSLLIPGIVLTISGQLLFLIAQKQNRFFSSTVNIQTEREHVVCDTGPYKIVRHPAYLGMVVQSAGFPFLFGSTWSILPVSLSILLILIRTYLEDKTLKTELPGYLEYAHKIRFRIFPFIW